MRNPERTLSKSERRPSNGQRRPLRTKRTPRRAKSLTSEKALENAMNDLKHRRHNSTGNRHRLPDVDGSFHSDGPRQDNSNSESVDGDELLRKIVAQRSRAPEPPANGDNDSHHNNTNTMNGSSRRNNNSTRTREEQMAAATRYNSNGQAATKQVPEGLDGPGAYSGAPGKDYELVEAALPAMEARQMLENSGDVDDEEIAHSNSSLGGLDSMVDDNSEAGETVPRGSAYLKHLEVGSAVKGVMALIGTLLVVIPFVFAVENNKKNTEAAFKELNESGNSTGNSSPDQANRIRILQELLPNETLVAVEEDPTSPQFKAYRWLLEDPWLEEAQDWLIHQRMAMATFYYAFGGDRWDQEDPQANGWLTYNVSVCSWLSTTQNFCHANLTVAQIELNQLEGFRGTMPAEIGLLSYLEGINFTNLEFFNRPLSALLHPNMAQLTALKSFACINCYVDVVEEEGVDLRGSPLPSTVGTYLPNLQSLNIAASQLTGSIPSEIGLLTMLTSLKLENNALESRIPTELGNLSLLNVLWLRENDLSNEIPESLWGLTALQNLDMNKNALGGTLSTEIGRLTALQHLDLKGGNRLTGTLPSELGLLTSLTGLKLGGNHFEGRLPDELQRLTNLDVLGLNATDLSGTIPWSPIIYQLKQLSELSLGDNRFTGSLPGSSIELLSNHTKLKTFDVSSNRMEGTLPSELGLLTTLTSLLLYENSFEGTLPSEFGLLTNLDTLQVTENPGLVGPVPREMCNVTEFDFGNFEFDWCRLRQGCCVWL